MPKGQKPIAAMLTVNAALLAGLLWVQVASKPVLAESAYAQAPNAGLQREQIIRQLAEIEKSGQAIKKVLESGYVRIVVIQPPKKKP